MKSWYAAIGWLKDGSVLSLARKSRENGLQVGRQTSHNVLDMSPQLNGEVVGQRQMIGLQERLLTPDTASLFHHHQHHHTNHRQCHHHNFYQINHHHYHCRRRHLLSDYSNQKLKFPEPLH